MSLFSFLQRRPHTERTSFQTFPVPRVVRHRFTHHHFGPTLIGHIIFLHVALFSGFARHLFSLHRRVVTFLAFTFPPPLSALSWRLMAASSDISKLNFLSETMESLPTPSISIDVPVARPIASPTQSSSALATTARAQLSPHRRCSSPCMQWVPPLCA
jgi:hypothetical protein